ncbi:MAG: response regulator transcription factor [Gemmatimonadales bacterium]|nr:response regulator transcription factor [Gemmatimonadales bacterium]
MATTLPILSQRQSEIVRYIGSGFATKQIAARMGISPHTVSCYLRRLMTRVRVHTRAELVVWAVRNGVISVGPSEELLAAAVVTPKSESPRDSRRLG